MIKVRLERPITDGEAIIAELELREPTVQDVSDIGYPFVLVANDGDTAIELKPKLVMRYAARLSGLPRSSLDGITLGDLSRLHAEIMGFFGDGAAAPQTLPTALLK
jgi:hypothetical protein